MSSQSEQEEFLTVAEVAGLLKLNQQTVRNWIDQGSLPALRIGRRVRIRRADLDKILQASRTDGAGGVDPSAPQGPSGEDFWSGEAVGVADVVPEAGPVPTEAD
jgi:excisionase family DNA binding protein